MAVLSSSSSADNNKNKKHKLLLSGDQEEEEAGATTTTTRDVHEHEKQSSSSSSISVVQLLPGLPDHLAQLCLSPVPPPLLFSVCRNWRRLLYSPNFPPSFPSIYALLLSHHHHRQGHEEAAADNSIVEFASFDPLTSSWAPLPPPPDHRTILHRHPSFISRQLPIQTASVAGKLVLLAATDRRLLPALPNPLVFDPTTSRWTQGPPMLSSPRRWCAAGGGGSSCLYVASGVGSEYSSETARSAEVWRDINDACSNSSCRWEAISPLRDSRFSREPVEMVYSSSSSSSSGGGGRRRLMMCMVDRKTKEGAVYNIQSDRWEDMPLGLLSGWTGPAASAVRDGTNAGDMDIDIHVVDEANGVIRRYCWERDTWTPVMCSDRLKGAVAMASWGQRLCVASEGGRRLTVVDVDHKGGGKTWDVLPPPVGKRVIAMHVLPRMSRDPS